MKSLVLTLLLLICATASAQSTVEVNVPPGDLGALRLAMSEAAAGDPSIETVIISSGTFRFTDEVGLPDVRTPVAIIGRDDSIIFEVNTGQQLPYLILVEEKGQLKLKNVGFVRDASAPLDNKLQSVIENRGVSEFLQVQIDSLLFDTDCQGGSFIIICGTRIIIYNTQTGQLFWDQVSVIDSGNVSCFNRCMGTVITNDGHAEIQNSQIYYSRDYMPTPLRNDGYMSLKNVTMFRNNFDGKFYVHPIYIGSLEAETYLSNTIISGFSGYWCWQATSLGHNLIEELTDTCDFRSVGDVFGVPAELTWQPVQSNGNWPTTSLNPILNHALVPTTTSPAVDSIAPALCPLGDLINNNGRLRSSDGNSDGIARCDMGAVELQLDSEIGLPPVHIADGGINGVYFDPDADGHYISIIENDYNTLVMWNSFDKNGDQYFVHATGELVDGHSMIADAYVNLSGGTSPEGEILPAQAVHWGTLVIDMNSCNEGTLAFHSDLPEFGSGQVQLERIVFVKQLDCVESEPEEVVDLRPATLAEGGINGVYFNPDADGHYISIIDTDYNTLVMWNSFDKDGNQYFVYGIGQLLAGQSLIASAYINVNGGTSPEGEILPAEAIHWGTLEVDMNSCNEGTLAFSSDLPEFGNGQVQLDRIVFMKQLGCVD